MSPVELAVVLDTATEQQSVTLAGDIAQKLHLDNGFSDWRHVLEELKLDHIEIEPLKLSYRSTHEILDFATDVLGPLRNEVSGDAIRYGAPVELFQFGGSGEAVGFLSEALRNLVSSEPLSSVAVIARYPEQADIYYKGLRHGEVPNLRRIAEQDFPFRPGVDVTDVRQVKGLEFDYVVVVECNRSTFPVDNETRHLLHIAATRAAHQLWVFSTGKPSLLLPEALVRASD
jgi:DNA helicase-2/ATP-dependent DNA helicase PcrA